MAKLDKGPRENPKPTADGAGTADPAVGDLVRRIGIDPARGLPGAVVLLRPVRGSADAGTALADALERRLGPNDRLARGDDGACLVAFADDTDLAARLRCALVVEEVAGLARTGAGRAVEVATVAADAKPPRIEPVPLARTLEDSLRVVRADAARALVAASDAGAAATTLDDVEFVFRPIVEVRSKVVSTFQCIPVRPVKGGFASGYGVLAGGDPEPIADLDRAMLAKVGEAATHRGRTRSGSSLALPVHFSTLADPDRHERYVEAFNEIFGRTEASLIVEIAGLPTDRDARRFARRAADLLRGARRLFVRCGAEPSAVGACRAIGAHAMGIDFYDRVEDEQTIMQTMDAFASAAKRGQFRSYVLGVRSISLYTAAVACGFDYVAGHALTAVVKDVEDIQRFQPDMPYFALLKAIAEPDSGP